jgi:hypothetical protein
MFIMKECHRAVLRAASWLAARGLPVDDAGIASHTGMRLGRCSDLRRELEARRLWKWDRPVRPAFRSSLVGVSRRADDGRTVPEEVCDYRPDEVVLAARKALVRAKWDDERWKREERRGVGPLEATSIRIDFTRKRAKLHEAC